MSQKYDKEYKVQAVLLARKIGNSNAAKELKVPEGTLYGWIKAAKVGELSFWVQEIQTLQMPTQSLTSLSDAKKS